MSLKPTKYDHWVKISELNPPLGTNKFCAVAVIHEIGGENISHGLGEVWGESREEVSWKMNEKVKQWIQLNDKF